MRRDYDIFEKFPDGSTLWRVCVRGQFEVKRKVQELAELSENEFIAIDIQAGELLSANVVRHDSRAQVKIAVAAHG